jgi:hypothetical protein
MNKRLRFACALTIACGFGGCAPPGPLYDVSFYNHANADLTDVRCIKEPQLPAGILGPGSWKTGAVTPMQSNRGKSRANLEVMGLESAPNGRLDSVAAYL